MFDIPKYLEGLEEGMSRLSIWIVLFSVLLSPLGLGYFFRGVFFGFKPFDIEDVFIGVFVSAPFFLCASFLSIDKVKGEIVNLKQRGKEITHNDRSKVMLIYIFLFQAINSWILILSLGVFWYLNRFNPLKDRYDLHPYVCIVYLILIILLSIFSIYKSIKIKQLENND
jgi:hypothetical protein